MPESEVTLEGLTKVYPGGGARARHVALDALTLEIQRGEIVALIGPSGCGKSTTLRLIAGLDDPDGGTLRINGKDMRAVAPQDRDVAMVFQGYALYPHMTARQIMEFPLRMRKVPRAERDAAVDRAAQMLGLTRLLNQRPDQMSGGERQRVAMGRAIVRKPRVFLFDEPLSNVDPTLREELRVEIGTLVRKLGATALYVTHDHVEAMTLADRVAVLQGGKLLQCASPREIYERPAAEFVGTFVGTPRMNVLDGLASGADISAGPFRFARESNPGNGAVGVGIRPEHVVIGAQGVAGEVMSVEPHGPESFVVVRVGDVSLRVRQPGFETRTPGTAVHISIDAARIHVFARGARDGTAGL